MNILYDHQMFCIQKFGGITRIFVELMRELSSEPECSLHWHRGLHIDSYDVSDYSKRLKRYWAFEKAPFFLHKRTNEEINKLSFKWFVRLLGGRYDIYHPTYYDFSLIDIVKAKKLVITVHDMIPEKYLTSLPRFGKLIDDRAKMIRKADLIFVNSQSTRNDLLDMFHIDPGRVLITCWASHMKNITPVAAPAQAVKRPYFLYVGTRSKYKNFEVLMRAFASDEWLKSHFNVVCFGGSGNFLEPERKFFKEQNMTENFLYLTGGDGLLKSLYMNAQALVYTSRYEGFGLPPLEAMECGCPVVCCPTSSVPEVVGDAALFFDPDSPEELVHCLHTIVEDTAKRLVIINSGEKRCGIFSWKKAADETFEGYQLAMTF